MKIEVLSLRLRLGEKIESNAISILSPSFIKKKVIKSTEKNPTPKLLINEIKEFRKLGISIKFKISCTPKEYSSGLSPILLKVCWIRSSRLFLSKSILSPERFLPCETSSGINKLNTLKVNKIKMVIVRIAQKVRLFMRSRLWKN